jgi:hypothetical protein
MNFCQGEYDAGASLASTRSRTACRAGPLSAWESFQNINAGHYCEYFEARLNSPLERSFEARLNSVPENLLKHA